MATQIVKVGSQQNIPTKEFVCDTMTDMAFIKTGPLPMGSTCLVIEGTKVFILSGDKVWKQM